MSSVIERTAKGGAGLFAATIVGRGFSLIFVVIASRTLGPRQFGLFTLALSVIWVIKGLAELGLPNTIQRFLSGSADDESGRLFGAILTVGLSGAAIGGICAYIWAPALAGVFEDPALTAPLRVLSLSVTLGAAHTLFRAVLQAREHIGAILRADAAKSVAQVIVLVTVFIWVRTAVSASWAMVGGLSVGLVWVLGASRGSAISAQMPQQFKEISKILRYSSPLMVAGFGYAAAQWTDHLMLGWLADATAVGVYAVAAALAGTMGVFHSALVSIFMPIAAEAYRRGSADNVRRAYLFVAKWVGAASGAVLLVFVGTGSWILQMFGPEYATNTTYHVLVLLSTLYFLVGWVGPSGALLQMSDRPGAELGNAVLFVVANLLLNYVLIRAVGVIGAAIATLASGLLRNALQVFQVAHWHSITPLAVANLAVLALTGAGCIALMVTPEGGRPLATGFVVSVLIAFVLYTASVEEKDVGKRLLSEMSKGGI